MFCSCLPTSASFPRRETIIYKCVAYPSVLQDIMAEPKSIYPEPALNKWAKEAKVLCQWFKQRVRKH